MNRLMNRSLSIVGLILTITALAINSPSYALGLDNDIVTDIYQPSHKPSNDLLQILQPLYLEEAKFTDDGQQLIVRGNRVIVNQILELLLQLDHPARLFQLDITSTPPLPNTTTYSTQKRNLSQKTFTITENTPLVLAKEQRSQQLGSLDSIWGQVSIASIKEAPVKHESLALNLHAATDTVYVAIELQTLSNGQYQITSNRISGPINQWLPVTGEQHHASQRKWSTQRSDSDALFIKVTPIR